MAVTVARLEAILSADTGRFDRSMRQSETRMQRVGGAAKVMGGLLAGALVVGLTKSVKEAIEAEKSQARLEQAFRNSKVPIDQHRAAIERAGTAAINLGFDDEALTDSLGSLIIATGDYKKAQELTTVAMDIARFKGIDLEASTKILTLAMTGSQRATKQLGITVPPVTAEYDRLKRAFGDHLSPAEKVRLAQAKINDKNTQAAEVIDTVRKKVRGQADAYSKTAQGEMEVFRAKVEELEEKLGKKLLPTLGRIVDKLIAFTDFLDNLNGKMERFGGLAGPNLIDMLQKADKWFGKWGLSVEDLGNDFQTLWGWINKVVDLFKWIIDNAKKVGGALGSIGGVVGRIPGVGDVDANRFKQQFMAGTGPGSVSRSLYDELQGARNMGLTLTSGYRPGAVTKHGTPSDHGVFPSKAIDVAGAPANMARFFSWLIGQTDVKQAFYDPLGSIFGGVLSSYREGGHSDHVHVATYDKGGYLRPGWNLAYNGLGRPEPVGAGTVNIYLPNYVGSKSELTSWLQNAARQFRRQNGRSMF